MTMRFLFSVMAGLVVAAPALADTLTYKNSRFGTSITFPAEIFRQAMEPPENGDGMTWLSDDGASLAIYAFNNALMQTPEEFADTASEPAGREGFEVTYRRVKDNWVVLSGYVEGDIFYDRFEFGANDVIHAMLLRFPTDLKPKYEPYIADMGKSLEGP